MLYKTAQDGYEKLKREFSRLMESFTWDGFVNFIETANHLPNWIEHHGTQEQKDAVDPFKATSLDWKICREIANYLKHALPDRRSEPLVTDLRWKSGGLGIEVLPSKRVLGAGVEFEIECNDSRKSGLEFVVVIFNHFRHIFEMAAFPPTQRSSQVFVSIKRSIVCGTDGDVEGALKHYDAAIRLKHRIKRRRKRHRWLEAGV